MEDIFGMIFTIITHINFEEITEFMDTTNYTIEQRIQLYKQLDSCLYISTYISIYKIKKYFLLDKH